MFDIIKGLGHNDALVTLSTLAHESQDEGIKIAAAAALAPYCHPKLQATPTPRFIENPIDVPEFTHLSDAESFLAKLATLVARGDLDIQTGLELSSLAKNWIESQYAREELAIKQINAGATEHEQVIRVTGGLPVLPGCENLIMPQINGQATNGHAALAAPTDAVPAIGSTQHGEPTNGQGPDARASEPDPQGE